MLSFEGGEKPFWRKALQTAAPSNQCVAHVFFEEFDHRIGMLIEEIVTFEAAGIASSIQLSA